ncbi:MAG: universal stress protein [Chlorobi bacterium]|nr:universal stress protein [Chlorobiota bacterium]
MQNILVPVDFSKDSMNALDHAVYLANIMQKSVKIIHVRKDKNYDDPFVIQGRDKAYKKTTEDFCDEIINEYRPKYKAKGTFDYVVKEGKIYKGITEQAERDKSLMIMMGTHGVSGFEEFWVGSNAYRVVCKAPCPVYTVRNGYKSKSIKKIVLPIDAVRETRMKIPFTAELATFTGAEVHVIAVRETNRRDIILRLEKYAEQAEEYLKNRNIRVVKDSFKGSDVSDLTIAYAVHNHASLISIVSNQRGTPINLSISTTAQEMVNHSPIPILSIHPSYSSFKG